MLCTSVSVDDIMFSYTCNMAHRCCNLYSVMCFLFVFTV